MRANIENNDVILENKVDAFYVKNKQYGTLICNMQVPIQSFMHAENAPAKNFTITTNC